MKDRRTESDRGEEVPEAGAVLREEAADEPAGECAPYDFTRQTDGLPGEFLNELHDVNIAYARAMTQILTEYLSRDVQVELLSQDQTIYQQFRDAIPEFAALATFELIPLEGMGLLTLNPGLAQMLLSCGIGIKEATHEPSRELTPVERGLLRDLIFQPFLQALGQSWHALAPLQPVPVREPRNAAAARIAQPADVMLVCAFHVKLGEFTDGCAYCLPIGNLDLERMLQSEHAWDGAADDANELNLIMAALSRVKLHLQACLPNTTLTLRELMSLQEGDVVHLDTEISEPIELRIEGQRRFHAVPVTVRDRVAAELISDMLEEDNDRTTGRRSE